MYKYLIIAMLWANISYAEVNLSQIRQDISSSLHHAVLEMKNLFKESHEDLGDVDTKNTQNKARVDQLKLKSEENESNPTVLDHAKKSIPNCDYNSKNLVWDGSAWKCIKMNVDTECQAAAPDEYMYTDSEGHKVCAKSPKGVSISYFYEFRAYSSKCTGAYSGYEKLYDCKYKNKLGQKIEVAASYCSGKSKPSVANKLCAKTWTVGSWGSCSKTCGGGTMTRSVYCQAGYNCSMYTKPTSSQSCNTQKCKGDWVKGSWSSCSATACGTSGKQTRSVYCPSSLDCSDKPKPSTTQSCSASACPICTWSTGSWGSCSAKACGTSGTKTRSVWKSGPSNCVGPYTTKPSTTTSCSAPACNYTYSWSYGSWGKCSATACGTSGKQTRSYSCKRSDGATVSNSKCSGTPKYEQTCSAPACNYTYKWVYGGWSSCSAKACGTSGKQTRSYKCVRSDGTVVSNSSCSGSPYYQKACSAPACNYTYSWSYGNWGSCSATKCGTSGKKTRSYSCKRSDGATVSNTYCSGSPYYQQPCSAPACVKKTCARKYVSWGSGSIKCSGYLSEAVEGSGSSAGDYSFPCGGRNTHKEGMITATCTSSGWSINYGSARCWCAG
jgi:hypothetical protein